MNKGEPNAVIKFLSNPINFLLMRLVLRMIISLLIFVGYLLGKLLS